MIITRTPFRVSFVGGGSDNNVTRPSRISRQDLVDFTGKDGRFNIQDIQSILLHLVIRMFGQDVAMVEDRVADSFQLSKGHPRSS